MKKITLAFFLCVFFLPGLPISAFDLATGVGLRINPYFEQLTLTATDYEDAYVTHNWLDWGIYVFFDAKYVEFDLSYYRTLLGSYEQSKFGEPFDFKTVYKTYDISYLELALLGKFPITIGPAGQIYIYTGFAYRFSLTADYGYKENNGDVPKEFWDQMKIKFGSGFDIHVYRNMFFRTDLSLGFSIITKEWKDRKTLLKNIFTNLPGLKLNYGGFGAELSLAIVYKIK